MSVRMGSISYYPFMGIGFFHFPILNLVKKNIGTLAKSYTVYAIDLLGFGASDKPAGYSYTMEAWAQLILDFLNEVIPKPTVPIGNSVGSLACVIAASGPPGPNPVQLMPSISIPVLVLWGDEDPFTPLDGPVGKYFSSLPSKLSNVKLIVWME
ncbi:hypothetical protein CUMW_283000 [Citrus unshiu]|uniref:AB hydrolase-1 domain-containing protein n=1 Tax=Citrus unshiu TaxID=55188 RepID=A0A2H5N5T8_CITUN|nr:hypothetical protein CUMW_283000 [Citrus unshiu]